jgi:hypothetical protein
MNYDTKSSLSHLQDPRDDANSVAWHLVGAASAHRERLPASSLSVGEYRGVVTLQTINVKQTSK